jgi:hypothetical protein
MTVISINRNQYELGEQITYEVLIRNDGQLPVTFPWSPDVALFNRLNRAIAGMRNGSLFLQAEDAEGHTLANLESQVLVGAPDEPNTLEVLAPGDTARIRLPGAWRTSDVEASMVLRQPRGEVRVRAVLSLINPPVYVKSDNSVDVVVTRRSAE